MRQELLSTVQVAEQLGVSEELVRYWRHANAGPPYQKVGGFHVYCLNDVLEYKEGRDQAKRKRRARREGG
jgi:DNA-binding transcriptional MerR regulator